MRPAFLWQGGSSLLKSTRRAIAVVLTLAPLVWGCSHNYSALEGRDGGCPTGSETCGCYPNDTCDDGLTCASNLCVLLPGGGTGGATGSGGAMGSGGAVGTGGVSATGGAGGATGSGGGAAGAGGAKGTGGVTATGGVTGTGGVAATGGVMGTGGVGGVTGTGGVTATGGVTGTGGVSATGGITGTGGTIPPANNQITNGDFSNGGTNWGITVQTTGGTGVTSSVTDGVLCVSIPTFVAITIGWPANGSPVAMLQAGGTYELQYQISTTATLYTFEVKVGQATPPYTQTDFITDADYPIAGVGLQTFTHTFIPTASDSVTGIAFNILTQTPTTVCLDNVALGTPPQ
jgi:hypothetical protein